MSLLSRPGPRPEGQQATNIEQLQLQSVLFALLGDGAQNSGSTAAYQITSYARGAELQDS